MENQVCQRLVASLSQRVEEGANAEHLANAIFAICQEISVVLDPILGQKGVAALYQRSLDRTLAGFPWMAAASESIQSPLGIGAIKLVIAQQSNSNAAAGGKAFLLSFCAVLSSLIGPPLTEQLLQSICNSNLNHSTSPSDQAVRYDK